MGQELQAALVQVVEAGELQIFVPEQLALAAEAGALQGAAHRQQQVGLFHGLGEAVRGARAQRHLRAPHVRALADEDDLLVRVPLAQARGEREAVHARHHHVGEDQVEGGAGRLLERERGVLHGHHAVAVAAEHVAGDLSEEQIVVDNEDGSGHGAF